MQYKINLWVFSFPALTDGCSFFFFNIPNVTDVFCTSRVFLQTLQDLNPERHDRKKKKGSLSRAPFFLCLFKRASYWCLEEPTTCPGGAKNE